MTSAGSIPSTASASLRSGSWPSSLWVARWTRRRARRPRRAVAGADPPAGAGEQADQGGVGPGVLEYLADGDEVGDLGEVEQPGEADDLDRDVAGDQGGLDLREVAGGAAQDGDLAGRPAGAHEVGDRVREPGDLLGMGGQQGAADEAVALGAGGGAQRLDALVHGAQGGCEPVGEVEEAAAAATVLAQRVTGGGGAVGVREVAREVVEVGDGGAAPAVDGLAGVADGGDGVPGRLAGAGGAAEEGGEQEALGDGGVLVFVEQDDPVLVAQDRADLGAGEGQLCGEGDLVAEVEEVAAPLGLPVAPGQREQFAAGLGGLGDLAQFGVAELGGLQRAEQFGVVRVELFGAYEVFGQLGVEGEQIADEGGEGPGQGGVGAGGLAQHAGRELVAGGVGEEADARFEPDAQSVLGQQPPGEGVVRGDAGLARGLSGSITSGSVTPAATSALRTRSASSPAALLVKVSPRTCSGATWPVPTSHTTRAAITVVFPDPAPATITCGAGGAVMQAVCSGVKGMPRSSLSCSGSVRRGDTPQRLTGATDNPRSRTKPGTLGSLQSRAHPAWAVARRQRGPPPATARRGREVPPAGATSGLGCQ